MRRRFGKVINELAKKDDKIVLIVGDIVMVFLMILEKRILESFLIQVFVNRA